MSSDPSPMPEDPGPVQDVEVAIATELLAILRDSYGTGAGSAKAYLNDDSVVVFFDDLQLQRSEEYLISAGEGHAVTDVRHHFQQAIEATFRAAVERATGRRVISFVSMTKLDPHYAVEVFRLGPATDAGTLDPRSDG
jgi:uncharacterized protein YbcI